MSFFESLRGILLSFKYAFKGIIYTLSTQRNMRVHLLAAITAIVLAIFLNIPTSHFIVVLLSIGLVMSMELMNTALEKVVDLVTAEYHPLAKVAKDAAAGAVLIAAFFAFLIGIYVFLEPLFRIF